MGQQGKETDAAMKSGWLRTADGGVFDGDAYLTISDPEEDVIALRAPFWTSERHFNSFQLIAHQTRTIRRPHRSK